MWPQSNSNKPIFIRFVLGGVAGAAATCIIHPFYVLKNSLKTDKNYIITIRTMIIKNGPMILYKGLAQQLIHQTLFSSIRIGVYSTLHDSYKDYYKEQPSFLCRMAMGVVATTLSSCFGIPADAIFTQLSEPSKYQVIKSKKEKVLTVINKIRREGFLALYRFEYGRKSAYNMIQLASYSDSKHRLQHYFKMKDDINLYILASIISSIAKAFINMPIKYIELHLEKRNCGSNNIMYYGVLHDRINFTEYRKYMRQFSWSMLNTVLTFVLLEKIANMYGEHVLGGKSSGSGL